MLSTKFLLKNKIFNSRYIFLITDKFHFPLYMYEWRKTPVFDTYLLNLCIYTQILPCIQRNTFDTSHFEKLRDILGQCFDCVDSVFSRCKHWVQRALAVCCRLRMKLLKLLWINLSSGNSRSYSCIEKIHWPFPMWASFKCLTKMKPNRTQK